MRQIILLTVIFLLFVSCNKNIYGKYNTNYSKDKSVFFQIILNSDHTVQKSEIHTISNFASGKFMLKDDKVICFLDSTKFGYPPDTLFFKIKGNRLYPVNKGVVNTKFYLMKE